MKKFVLTMTAALAASGFANAQKFLGSPAQDLFDQAVFFLETQYFGPSKLVNETLFAKYQVKLDEACTSTQTNCGFDKAEPVLQEMLSEVGTTDPHTYYLSAAAVAARSQQIAGTVTAPAPRLGFTNGFYVELDGQKLTVGSISTALLDLVASGRAKILSRDRIIINVIPGGPAQRAGLKYGDRWIGYNGTLFSSATNSNDYNNLVTAFSTKVAAGETVVLNILRGANRERIDISAKGEIINLTLQPSLEIRSDGVGILRIPDYLPQGVGQSVHNLMNEVNAKNLRAVILNVRDNGGGLGQSQVATTKAFFENNPTYYLTRRYNPEKNNQEWAWINGNTVVRRLISKPDVVFESLTIQNPALFKGKVAVLVDEGCASACEYLASAIQKNKRGTIIGTPTFGIGDTNTAPFNLVNGATANMPTTRAFWTDGTPLPSTVTPEISVPDAEYQLFETGIDLGVTKALESFGTTTLQGNITSIEVISPFAPIPNFGYDAIQSALEQIHAPRKTSVVSSLEN
jgi:carboxyl-terminal processing protease